MTARQALINKPVSVLGVLGLMMPVVIILITWGINVNVRLTALEIEVKELKDKSTRMEESLDGIDKSLNTIAISINTLNIKWEMEHEKAINRKLEK